MRVREDEFRRLDGSTGTFAVVSRNDFVVVLCLSEGRCLMTEQYRYAADRWSLELPQGAAEPGETAAGAALRELREETGWEAADPVELSGPLYEAADWATQSFTVVALRALREGTPSREPDEAGMRSRWVPVAELPELVRAGRILDAATLAALALSTLSVPPSRGPVATEGDVR